MPESQLLARLAQAEARIKQLEYQVQLLKQAAGKAENTINQIRPAGAG